MSGMPNPRALSTATASPLYRFFQTWQAALWRCLPPRLQGLWSRQTPWLLVRLQALPADTATLWRMTGEQSVALGDLSLNGMAVATDVAAALRTTGHMTQLEVPAAWVLVREVQLPVQVREQLAQTMAYEMDRLTPFTADEVYFDAHITDHVARGKLLVTLAVCRRAYLSAWLQRLQQVNVAPAVLTWTGAWAGANLLPVTERPRRHRITTGLTVLLLALTITLLTATLVSPVWQRQQQEQMLTKTLRQLKRDAEVIPALRTELEHARAGSVSVLTYRLQAPRLTDLLRELTQRLPDDTWVQTFNYVNGEVEVRGQSGAATALIGLLEPAPGMSAVSFRSPVMQMPQAGKERFHLALTYRQPPAGAKP